MAGFGIAAAIIVALMISAYYAAARRVAAPDNRHVSEKSFTFARSCITLAVALGIVAVIMTAIWTKQPTTADANYLGKPSWQNNLFAWHPVLMVCGFFLSQLNAIASWSFFSEHYTAKLMHVFWQIAGMSSMIAGLWAVWKHKIDTQSFNFTTAHSWLGIAAVALYIFTFLWGSLMASLTRCYPDSILRKAFDLKTGHKNLGILVLVFTTIAILTGIMDQLPQGVCNPNIKSYKSDAAQYYDDVPGSCRLTNGLSIVVAIAAGLAALAIAYRGDSFGFAKESATNAPSVSAAPLVAAAYPVSSSVYAVSASHPSPKGYEFVNLSFFLPNISRVESVHPESALG